MNMNLEQLIYEVGGNVTLQEIRVVLMGRVMRVDADDIVSLSIHPPEPYFPSKILMARWFVKLNSEGDIACILQTSLPSDSYDLNILDINDYHAKKAIFFPEDRKVGDEDFADTVFRELKSGDVLQALYVHPPKHQGGKYFPVKQG